MNYRIRFIDLVGNRVGPGAETEIIGVYGR